MLPLESLAFLVLPPPISTNNLFFNLKKGKGRAISGEYRKWKKLAEEQLAAQRPLPRFALPVDVVLYVGELGVGQMDSDNTAKAYLDALKAAGVIHDDSRKWVRSSSAIWVPRMRGCVARVAPADPPPVSHDLAARIPLGLRGLLR